MGEAARNVDVVPRSGPFRSFHVVRPGRGADERVDRFVLTIPGEFWVDRLAFE